jgi:3-methylfumaryl-CoA hydratase
MNKIDQYESWVGKKETTEALVTSYQADALTATLDRQDPPYKEGDEIPPGWHLFYIREVVRLEDTAPDGHPKRGDFMPPINLPRRMWAGTKATYHKPIHIGEMIRKVTTIDAVTPKVGRTGKLVFLSLKHEIFGESGLSVTELQDVVYREEAKPGTNPVSPPTPPGQAVWSRDIHPTPVLLFRFSALTMNSHRIHYDHKYVTEVEHYPGLLVHGPLTLTLLMDLFRREMPGTTLRTFNVRAVSPLYDIHDFRVQGCLNEDKRTAQLWAVNHNGGLAMSADAGF